MTVRTKGILTHYLDAKAWGWKPRLARDYAISLYAKRNNLKHSEAQALLDSVLKNLEHWQGKLTV